MYVLVYLDKLSMILGNGFLYVIFVVCVCVFLSLSFCYRVLLNDEERKKRSCQVFFLSFE